MNNVRFEMRPIEDLIPYARNARLHSEEQIAVIAESIREFGFLSPIVVSDDGGILAGHGRLLGAQSLGMKTVPCVVESHLTDVQKRAYILADNRIALDAGTDAQKVREELEKLRDAGFNLLLTGYKETEINALMSIDNAMLSDDFDFDGCLKEPSSEDSSSDNGESQEQESCNLITCPVCGHQFEAVDV